MTARKQSTISTDEVQRLTRLVSGEELDECYLDYLKLSEQDGLRNDDIPTAPADDVFGGGGSMAHAMSMALAESSGCDLGVEEEAIMSEGNMLESLGLSGCTSIPWLHQAACSLPRSEWAAGLSASQASARQREMDSLPEAELPELWRPLSLRWHQLAGIHALLRQLLADGPKAGVLLADEVGVGKTGTALGLIALMMHYTEASRASGRSLSGLASAYALTY